jgi:hypothetical protein
MPFENWRDDEDDDNYWADADVDRYSTPTTHASSCVVDPDALKLAKTGDLVSCWWITTIYLPGIRRSPNNQEDTRTETVAHEIVCRSLNQTVLFA